MTDKAELLQLARDYSHRADFDSLFDAFLDFTESRISEQLRSAEMVVFAQIDTSAVSPVQGNAYALPDDFLQMKDVTVNISGGRVGTLRAVGRDEINLASSATAGGVPSVYNIQDLTIEVRPGPSERIINLTYYGRLAQLVADTDTNELLDRYTALYLYGILTEVWNWSQNDEQRDLTRARFEGEIEAINSLSWNQEFGTAPTGFSGYNYAAVGSRL